MKPAIALALLLTSQVWGAEFGPRRPSDVVTLVSSGALCPTPIGGDTVFDRRVLADGTRVPFTLPAGKVLVVTGLEFTSSTRSESVAATLFYGNTTTGDSFITVGDGHSFGSDMVVYHDTSVPNLVVKTPLCFETADGFLPQLPFYAVVHGFLAPDR
jgi:hypothetical protein